MMTGLLSPLLFLLLLGLLLLQGVRPGGTPPEHGTYIVGGKTVDTPGKWPWQGSLQYLGRHRCGAVLIAPYYVLTSAHCVYKVPVNLMWVTFGLHDKDTQYEGDPQSYKIAKITTHPKFESLGNGTYGDDLAVIQLTSDRPADVTNEYIQTIAMAPDNATYMTSQCVITGWGNTKGPRDPDGVIPNILQEAPTSVLPLAECQALWPDAHISEGHVCLTYNNTTSACLGDEGGPLVCQPTLNGSDVTDSRFQSEADAGRESTQAWQLAGIGSWSDFDCNTTKPSIYVRIAYYRTWIKEITGV